jgi:hypothetical protein
MKPNYSTLETRTSSCHVESDPASCDDESEIGGLPLPLLPVSQRNDMKVGGRSHPAWSRVRDKVWFFDHPLRTELRLSLERDRYFVQSIRRASQSHDAAHTTCRYASVCTRRDAAEPSIRVLFFTARNEWIIAMINIRWVGIVGLEVKFQACGASRLSCRRLLEANQPPLTSISNHHAFQPVKSAAANRIHHT